MSWNWVNRQTLVTLHDMSLAEHGGASGIRDQGLLESALARPENLAAYDEPDYASLAASYGFELAKNHAFVDGNKRVAFLSVRLFLFKNGYRLNATQTDATLAMLGVAPGELDELAFADWIRTHSVLRR